MTDLEKEIESAFVLGGYQAKKLYVTPQEFAIIQGSFREPGARLPNYVVDVAVDYSAKKWRLE